MSKRSWDESLSTLQVATSSKLNLEPDNISVIKYWVEAYFDVTQ